MAPACSVTDLLRMMSNKQVNGLDLFWTLKSSLPPGVCGGTALCLDSILKGSTQEATRSKEG